MRIEITETDDGLHGEREVWVRVLSNTMTDWPTVKLALSPEQREALAECEVKPSAYYPGDSEDGYPYADIWVFGLRRNAK